MNYNLDLTSKSTLPKEHIFLLDKIADEIRPDYVDFVSNLQLKYFDNIDLLLTPLLSRNTLDCKLFDELCKLELINRLSSKGKVKSVKVDNPFFYASINKSITSEILVHNEKFYLTRIFEIFFKNLKLFIFLIYNYSSRYLYSSLFRFNNQVNHQVPITIVDTVIYKSSFNENKFIDRHFPGILKFNTEEENTSVFYMAYYYRIYDFISLFKNLKYSDQNFLIPEFFLKFSDYFLSIFTFTRLFKKFEKIKFKNYDITDLFIDSYYENIVNIATSEGVLRYRLIKRLSEKKIKIKRLVQWFENQPLNKGTIIGFNKYYPNTRTVGHLGFYSSLNVVGIYPSSLELEKKLLPNEISVIGNKMISEMTIFCPSLKATVSPAFRFQELLKLNTNLSSPFRFTILLALPIFLLESITILSLIASSLKKLSNIVVKVKTHPGSNKIAMQNALNKFGMEDCVTYQNMHNAILSSTLIVTSASSSALESIFSGKPTLIISNCRGLIKNPIPSGISKKLYSICYDESDVLSKIKYFINFTENDFVKFKQLTINYRNDYVELQTKDNTRALLGLQ